MIGHLAPHLTQFNYSAIDLSNCPHEYEYRSPAGISANGKRRWRCAMCRRRFTEGVTEHIENGFHMDKRLRVMKALMKPGASGANVRRTEQVSSYLVAACVKLLRTRLGPNHKCACGMKWLHNGRCRGTRRKPAPSLFMLQCWAALYYRQWLAAAAAKCVLARTKAVVG